MFTDFTDDYCVSETISRQNLRTRKRRRPVVSDEVVNANSAKHQARLAFADFYRRENARLRRPCPKCSNLVQPHLLGQHYEAYHPGVTIPTPPSL